MIGNDLRDWAQSLGQRDTSMVSYRGGYWQQFVDIGSRTGAQGMIVFLKVYVRPVPLADLGTKRIGVVYRTPGVFESITVTGWFFTVLSDGCEEWHVPVTLRTSSQYVVTFTAWYQDGNGRTFYDDNNGQLHAVTWTSDNFGVIQHLWPQTNVVVTPAGVQGAVAVRIADLAFAKDVRLVGTTDNWATVRQFGIGAAGAVNAWHWVQDFGDDYEQWEVALQIPGNFQAFEYAMVYRHGGVSGARPYEFWSNNGGANWDVQRTP